MTYSQDLSNDLLDAGKRAAGIINTYRAGMEWEELKTKFLAIRLSDGGSDGVLYDSKRDAVKHQLHENLCAYVAMRNLVGGANAREMAIFLKFNRDAYDKGFRLTDPDDRDGGKEPIITARQGDYYRRMMDAMQARRVLARLRSMN